jgi:hypothetical protein
VIFIRMSYLLNPLLMLRSSLVLVNKQTVFIKLSGEPASFRSVSECMASHHRHRYGFRSSCPSQPLER